MSRPRTSLDDILRKFTDNLYYQPPANVRLVYPCIIYELDSAYTRFSDNHPYIYDKRYKVTVIDRNPDSEIPDRIAKLPLCTFDRHYVSDNLHHFVFNLYY